MWMIRTLDVWSGEGGGWQINNSFSVGSLPPHVGDDTEDAEMIAALVEQGSLNRDVIVVSERAREWPTGRIPVYIDGDETSVMVMGRGNGPAPEFDPDDLPDNAECTCGAPIAFVGAGRRATLHHVDTAGSHEIDTALDAEHEPEFEEMNLTPADWPILELQWEPSWIEGVIGQHVNTREMKVGFNGEPYTVYWPEKIETAIRLAFPDEEREARRLGETPEQTLRRISKTPR